MTLTLEKPPIRQDNRHSWGGFEGCTNLQPGQVKLVQEKEKENEDRPQPEAMAQVS